MYDVAPPTEATRLSCGDTARNVAPAGDGAVAMTCRSIVPSVTTLPPVCANSRVPSCENPSTVVDVAVASPATSVPVVASITNRPEPYPAPTPASSVAPRAT